MIIIIGVKGEGKKLVFRQDDGSNHVVRINSDGSRTILFDGPRPVTTERPPLQLR